MMYYVIDDFLRSGAIYNSSYMFEKYNIKITQRHFVNIGFKIDKRNFSIAIIKREQ